MSLDDYRALTEGATEEELLALVRETGDRDLVDRIGKTALGELVEHGGYGVSLDLVQLLLQAGADPSIPGWMGISALDSVRNAPEPERELLSLLNSLSSPS